MAAAFSSTKDSFPCAGTILAFSGFQRTSPQQHFGFTAGADSLAVADWAANRFAQHAGKDEASTLADVRVAEAPRAQQHVRTLPAGTASDRITRQFSSFRSNSTLIVRSATLLIEGV